MKKICLMALFVATLFASATAQVKLNVHAGTITTMNHVSKKAINTPDYHSQAGFVLGGNVGVRLFKNIWSESGLSYNLRRYGYKTNPLPEYFTDVDFRIGYLTLNQLFLTKIKGKKGWSFSTGAGFFAGLPFHGRYTITSSSNIFTQFERGNLDFGNNNSDNFKQFDAGANLLLRLQFKKLLLNLLYSHSLTDHIPAGYNRSNKERFRGFSITLGYEF